MALIHFFTYKFDVYDTCGEIQLYTNDGITMMVKSRFDEAYFRKNDTKVDTMQICDERNIVVIYDMERFTLEKTIPWTFVYPGCVVGTGYSGVAFVDAVRVVRGMISKYDMFFVEVLSLYLHRDVVVIIYRFFVRIFTPGKMKYGWLYKKIDK